MKPVEKGTYHIRPAARHILTIGRDLIKDSYAAIMELVKNSYDADATEVAITFSGLVESDPQRGLKIKVEDNGHGMSFETVTTKWLVPSTDDKLVRRYSPKKRLMQGRKGIGRYAAAILGDEMLLLTVCRRRETSMLVNWRDFEKEKYLEDVEFLVEAFETKEPSGTTIEITGDSEKIAEWTKPEIKLLIKELRKLLSPFGENECFVIKVIFEDFPVEEYKDREIIIEPFPIIDLFDYRLTGTILRKQIDDVEENFPVDKSKLVHAKKNKSFDDYIVVADLTYENKSEKSIPSERIVEIIDIKDELCTGRVEFDFRVFDRDPEAIENLVERGLKSHETGSPLGKREAAKLLDEICGVGVYRGGFRIRPYGDPGYDWLELDKHRVQDPSRKIGRNQIAGFVTIEPEERSHLEEKSARDGLRENKYYEAFKTSINRCLLTLEEKRYLFRRKTGKGRKLVKIEEELQTIFDFEKLDNRINRRLKKLHVPEKEILQISQIITKESLTRTNFVARLKETVARYQGQVTLGKIIMVLMHEGRKPLSFFKNQIPLLDDYIEHLKKRYDKDYLTLVLDNLNRIQEQEEFLVKLFDKLDPLAVRKRGKKKRFRLHKVFTGVSQVFESDLKRKWITFNINCDSHISVEGWNHDFYIALTNLVENSIYWLGDEKTTKNKIELSASTDDGALIIDYRDNGPGIKKEYIESQVIFEPDFTTKPNGTGLGLAIAGEALHRNNGTIKAIHCESGAYFRIELERAEEN